MCVLKPSHCAENFSGHVFFSHCGTWLTLNLKLIRLVSLRFVLWKCKRVATISRVKPVVYGIGRCGFKGYGSLWRSHFRQNLLWIDCPRQVFIDGHAV